MDNTVTAPSGLRLFTWIPVADLPSPEESTAEGYSLLLAIKDIGIGTGCYMPNENQFYQHCQRYSAFDDEPIPGGLKEETINSCLEWEMEEVYPEGHYESHWGNVVTHWMLVPDAPTE